MAGPATEGVLTKFRKVVDIIRFNGGIRGSLYTLFKMDELKKGELIGTDKYGNEYYQNNEHFVGRNRWVKYADQFHLDYDGSQIPAEWHRWLHHTTDTPPNKQPPVNHRWLPDHTENWTGTSKQYVPYSTTKPKIEAWSPPKSQ